MQKSSIAIIISLLYILNTNTCADFLFYEANGYLITDGNEIKDGPLTGYVVVSDIPIITYYNVSYKICDFYFDGGDLGFFRGDYGQIAYHKFDTYLNYYGYGLTTYLTYDIEEANWGFGEDMIIPKLRPSYNCNYPSSTSLPFFSFNLTCKNYPCSVPEYQNPLAFMIGLMIISAAVYFTSSVKSQVV